MKKECLPDRLEELLDSDTKLNTSKKNKEITKGGGGGGRKLVMPI